MAAIRPDSWNFPLLLHVAGAMILVGALTVVLGSLILARRNDDAVLVRLGFRVLLLGALPAFVVMRAGAEWIKSESGFPDDLAWIGIGYGVSDGGLLLLIAATVAAWLAVRRLRAGAAARGPATAGLVLLAINLAAYAVAIWAMTAKPD